MPIYEYQCDVCGHTFEVMQKFSDEPIEVCTRCSGSVHRVLSAPGLVFKGTGWYVTDYASPERKKAMEGEKKEGEKKEGEKKETSTPSDSSGKDQKSEGDKTPSGE
ncbi:MAG: FmdB family zinc ribbon protein [candidate division NC10 bacterium]